jgi:hypothetical protein
MFASLKEELKFKADEYTPALLHLLQLLDSDNRDSEGLAGASNVMASPISNLNL